MLTMLESKLGCGTTYASPSSRVAEMDFVNQQVGSLSYSQMLRMSIEESAEGMGCSTQLRSDIRGRGYGAAKEEAYMGSSARQQEEGFAENDYDLTCLTLGRGASAAAAAPCSASSTDVRPSCFPQPVSRSSTSGFTRTCKLCGTSKTPLWRSGPMGAKSLCNACGIRSNKAKKLSAAAVPAREEDQRPVAAGAAGGWAACKSKQTSKAMKRKMAEHEVRKTKTKKKSEVYSDCADQLATEELKLHKSRRMSQQQQEEEDKKPAPRLHVNEASSPVKTDSSSCVTSPGTPSPCSTQRRPLLPMSMFSTRVPPACSSSRFDDRVFAKDEEQAAFCLMALSCGLVLA